MSPRRNQLIGSSRWALPVLLAVLLGAPSAAPQGLGPELPPGFYGIVPAPFPGPEAPAGVKRLALVYTGCILGETEPCG